MLDFLLSCLNSFWPTSAGIFWIDDLNERKNFHWGLPLQWSSKESSFLKRTHTVYFIFELNARPINNSTFELEQQQERYFPL